SGFQIWEGNDFGDFQLKNRVAIDGRITDFNITDLNKDNLSDLIVTVNPASLQIAVNNGGDSFSECVEYACGTDPQRVFTVSGQEGYSRDCIVFEKNAGQFIAYCNIVNMSGFHDSLLIATGVAPEEIITDDFNNDGVSDIALLNVQSRSVSLYFGQKNSAPSGPVFYPLTEKPKHIVYHSSTDTTLQFVLSFPQSHQISYLVIDSASNSVLNAFIGTEGDAQIVDASRNDRHQAEFVTWNRKRTEGNSLRFYEQLGQTTFIERSFHLSKPDILLGAAVTDLNGDKFQDIVYFFQTGNSSKVELGIAFGDSMYSMKRSFISGGIPLTVNKQIAVWLVDFDRDDFLDMLIQTGPPDECFMAAGGKGEGYFTDAVRITDSLSISDRSAVQITDVNGDNLPDVVIGSQQLGCVYWFRNENYCNFSSKEILFSEKGFSRFAVMDIDADGEKDLALTFSKKGFLKVINGKILQIHLETDDQ
ncbi:MAG: VCBS repeat-containing protein, partial [Bacteroidetes bacterium]|nr:VCBS repeat-containing protein [Bacteroidota bacterium]